MKTVFGVFGDPVEHSLSPEMHNAAFSELGMDSIYHAFRVDKKSLEYALNGANAMGFGGVNITVPLKQEALKFVNTDPLAFRIGAVNTIDFRNENAMIGYNTDGVGARRAIADAGVDIKNKKILILGAGGASRAICFQFANDGADLIIANRTESKAVELAEDVKSVGNAKGTGFSNLEELVAESDILINTTTVGMHPNTKDTIITKEQMHSGLVVFDIVYNPLETRLLKEAKSAGAIPVNGLMMFVYQGAEAFKIWTGENPPIEVMKNTVLEELKS